MITMTDIANKAGVARSTVSHVLNDSQSESVRVSEATRQRILKAASELGYRPNELARAVRSGKTRMIGYLIMEPNYEPHWNTLVGALAEAEVLGFTLKVFSVTKETLAERVRQCVELRLGGIIVRVIPDKSPIFEEANAARIPVVTVDEGIVQPFGVTIASDDAIGCKAAITHLKHFGHSRIGFISSGFPQMYHGEGDIGTAREKMFRLEMQAQNLEVPEGYVTHETMSVYGLLSEADDNQLSATQAIQALLSHPQGRPTAIFCWRDETAMVALRVCKQQGLRVPDDISIIGFSNISAAKFADPPLSTVNSPWEEMGRLAMREVCQRTAEEFDPSPVTRLVASSFVARESTGPAPVGH
jgi:LacI family transcriptional regulator